MKYRVIVSVVALAFLAAPVLGDFTPYLADGPDVGASIVNNGPWRGANGGGEFEFSNANLSNSAYAVTTRNQGDYAGSFQTFCVETDEFIYPPHYQVEITIVNESGPTGSRAVMGGSGGPEPDPLDPRTAWLYTQWATGNIGNYDYANSSFQRTTDATQMQIAIWYLEEEKKPPQYTVPWVPASGSKAEGWVALANASTWTDVGNVRVLNLYDNIEITARQDMLYLVPVPGAVLLGFLGLGYAGMRLRKMA